MRVVGANTGIAAPSLSNWVEKEENGTLQQTESLGSQSDCVNEVVKELPVTETNQKPQNVPTNEITNGVDEEVEYIVEETEVNDDDNEQSEGGDEEIEYVEEIVDEDHSNDHETVAESVQESMCSSTDENSVNVAVDGQVSERDNRVELSRLVPKSSKPNLVSSSNHSKAKATLPKVEHSKIKWEKPEWALKPKLKATAQGAVVKEGADLQAPITHINADKQQMSSPAGHGETEEKRDEKHAIQWEKPEWTKTKPLKPTELGDVVKKGEDLSAPITNINAAKQEDGVVPIAKTTSDSVAAVKWEKPEWTQRPKLRSTQKGEEVKKGGSLQKPITHVEKDTLDDINFEANPMILKSTKLGSAARFGENLAKPITHIEKDPMGDVNFEANQTLLQESREGKALKVGVSLARPITFPEKNEGRDANFEANPAMLKATGKGNVIRQGIEIARPITFPNGKSAEDDGTADGVPDPIAADEDNEGDNDDNSSSRSEYGYEDDEVVEYVDDSESDEVVIIAEVGEVEDTCADE